MLWMLDPFILDVIGVIWFVGWVFVVLCCVCGFGGVLVVVGAVVFGCIVLFFFCWFFAWVCCVGCCWVCLFKLDTIM